MNLLDQESIPELFETITESAIKALEESEILAEGGLMEAVPLGKLAKFFTRKIIEIKDPAKALKKAISIAGYKTFVGALNTYSINPKVNEQFIKEDLPVIKQKLKEKNCDITSFNLDDFGGSDIVKFYAGHLMLIVKNVVTEREYNLISGYLNNHFKLSFLEILDENEVVYKNLNDLLTGLPYEEAVKMHKYERYRQELRNHFDEIVLGDPNGLRLSDIYIEPGYAIHKNCFEDKDSRLEKKDSTNDKGFVRLGEESVHDLVYRFIQTKVDDKLRSKDARVLFLLGYPGQGKSSFCKKLLNDSIDGRRAIDRPVYFLKFRSITDTIELINSPLLSIEKNIGSIAGFAPKRAEFEKSLLVLDGLDELFMKENMPSNAIDEFCRLITNEIRDKTDLRVIITSRYGYINLEQLRNGSSLVLQLNEFTLQQQIEWLKSYSLFHPEASLTVKKLQEIHSSEYATYLKELISQPILLHMVAVLKEGIDLKANRAMIYDNLYTQLIERSWDREKQIDGLEGLKKEDLREFLREIAFAIYISGKEYIHKSTLSDLPATKQFIEKLDNKSFKDALKRIMIAFYFQETKKDKEDDNIDDHHNYAIEFLHKSLQEYLVAEKIWCNMLEFIEQKRNGKYIIDEDEQALIEISKIFSVRLLTPEVRAYLKEIILNDTDTDKRGLCARLEKFLPYCLDQQFYSPSAGMPSTVIHATFANFYGYWFVLSHLGQKRNLTPQSHKDKFTLFLKMGDGEKSPFNLAWQDLSDANLNGIDFSGSDLSFGIFKNSRMIRCSLADTHLEETDFSSCQMDLTNFFQSSLRKINFKRTSLIRANFKYAKLLESSFEGADCFGCNFLGSIFHKTNLEDCSVAYAIFRFAKELRPTMFIKSSEYNTVADFSNSFIAKIEKLKKEAGIALDEPFKQIQ
jgi:uncharacterized protein YjbI with pentapeptide repeats